MAFFHITIYLLLSLFINKPKKMSPIIDFVRRQLSFNNEVVNQKSIIATEQTHVSTDIIARSGYLNEGKSSLLRKWYREN